ncbi:MAG: protein-L-isoaspartate(D-aspartate) O-methyltransferase [Bdellovibrionaceae bacterium]|nr:protein-L-isoaspartate(D-aspartate) O-methyltransferase [Pseudobdellovibrionaceae bacterium]
MVENQLVARGIKDGEVLEVMLKIPRENFVPPELQPMAYRDRPLAIGEGQTISQPYIVAYMAEALHLSGQERVLEIGTGCGYNTAVLAKLAGEVYTVEIRASLSNLARDNLASLGIDNVHFKVGDGYLGWPEMAPFDRIVLTAAPSKIPKALFEQVTPEGCLLAPVGDWSQTLQIHRRQGSEWFARDLLQVQFVPLVRDPEEV